MAPPWARPGVGRSFLRPRIRIDMGVAAPDHQWCDASVGAFFSVHVTRRYSES